MFLCGLIDAYCFLYRNETFTIFQTGNLIKMIIFYVKGYNSEASYSLIIFFPLYFLLSFFILYPSYLKTLKLVLRL